ncbi:MAG: CoA-binding protein [Thermoplasmatota archaeon]
MDRTHDDEAMAALLGQPRRIALIGASPNPERASHRVMLDLLRRGHDVIPVNPVADEVAGIPAVPDIAAAAARWNAPPEIVDVFRAPEYLPPIVDAAIEAGSAWLWLQLGVVDDASRDRAVAAGLNVVMDRCIKMEAARLT